MKKILILSIMSLITATVSAESFFLVHGPEDDPIPILVEGQDSLVAQLEILLEAGEQSFKIYQANELNTFEEWKISFEDPADQFFAVSWVENNKRWLYRSRSYLDAESKFEKKRQFGAIPYNLNMLKPLIEKRTRFVLPAPT